MLPPEISKDQLHALWESGISLDSAWIEFAVFVDRFALRALCTYPENDPDVLGGGSRYKELSKGWLPRTWDGRQKKLRITTQNERVHLLGEIYAGRLWAIGYRTLPSGSDELTRVPRQSFYVDEAGEHTRLPDILWGKGELTVGDASYFDIRILRAPLSETHRQPSTSAGAAQGARAKSAAGTDIPSIRSKTTYRKKAGGRPNTSPAIGQTARKLWRTNSRFRTLPVKRMIPEVRAAILGEARRDEETGGYRSSSMAKIIGSAIANLRKRNIRNKPTKPQAT